MRHLMLVTTTLALLFAGSVASADNHAQRARAEANTREAVGPSMTVTRRDNGGGPASRAHGEGRAFDYTSSATTPAERDAEARRVSAANPSNVTTIVETPIDHVGGRPTAYGPTADRHDIYKSGRYVKTQYVAPRATGPHTHVQVDRCVRACAGVAR